MLLPNVVCMDALSPLQISLHWLYTWVWLVSGKPKAHRAIVAFRLSALTQNFVRNGPKIWECLGVHNIHHTSPIFVDGLYMELVLSQLRQLLNLRPEVVEFGPITPSHRIRCPKDKCRYYNRWMDCLLCKCPHRLNSHTHRKHRYTLWGNRANKWSTEDSGQTWWDD